MPTLPLPPDTFRQRLDRIKKLVGLTATAPDVPAGPVTPGVVTQSNTAVNGLIGQLTKKARPMLDELLDDIIPENRTALYGGHSKPGAQDFEGAARNRASRDDLESLLKEATLQVELHEWIAEVKSALG